MRDKPIVGIPVPGKTWYAGWLYQCYTCFALTYGIDGKRQHEKWHEGQER